MRLTSAAGTATIVAWMAEVQAERLAAEQELGFTVAKAPLTRSQIKAIVLTLDDHLRMLADADPATKATLYANLGIALTYHPHRQIVTVEANLAPARSGSRARSPRVPKSVSEGGLATSLHRLCSRSSGSSSGAAGIDPPVTRSPALATFRRFSSSRMRGS